ncbi:MAG: outer membrane beta-barrel protein [Bacteroidetes bacterium]|nr:outer membrane beta-barrel protein [Bacteroidota bacterium]
MKKTFFIFITILPAFFISRIYAQDSIRHYFGVKAGISIPNITTGGGSVVNELNSGYSSSLGPDFAIFSEMIFSKHFSITSQLEYSAQGGKKDGFQALPTPENLTPYFTMQSRPVPDVVYATFNSTAKINYMILSELAKYILPFGQKSNWAFYGEAGPFVGFLVSAHQVTSGKSDIYADKTKQENITGITQMGEQSFDNTQDIKDQLHKANFGIEGDIGFSYNFFRSKIFIEGGGNYGFLNIQKGTENGKNHIGAGTVRLGYAIGIK